MVVYIEYAVADNFVIDAMLLYGAVKTAHCRVRVWRIVAAAALGTAFALALPFFSLGNLPMLTLKTLVAAIMVLVASEFGRAKKFFGVLGLFFLYTFLAGGAIIGVRYLLMGDLSLSLGYTVGNIPVGAVVAACAVVVKVCMAAVKRLNRKKHVYSLVYDLLICGKNGETFKASGFFDSGNRLYSADGRAVVMCSRKMLEKLLRLGIIGEGSRVPISAQTMSGGGKIIAFPLEKMVIYFGKDEHIIENIMIGASTAAGGSFGDFDVLLHSSMCGELYESGRTD